MNTNSINQIAKLARQKYLNSQHWEDNRLECVVQHMVKGKLHCYTCGRPFSMDNWETDKERFNIHHLRYPSPDTKFIPVRDCMPVCGKCHRIIHDHPDMEVPSLSKRGLKKKVNEYLRRPRD